MKWHLDGHGIRWPHDDLGDDTPIYPDEVQICRDFLDNCIRIKVGGRDSYAMKHVIEDWAGTYVSNGACIQAALDLGIRVRPIHTGYSLLSGAKFYDPCPINAWIGISKVSVRDALCSNHGRFAAGGSR